MSNKLFDRLSSESSRAYATFQEYLDLGPDRTLRQVVETSNISESKVRIWSAKFNWRDRANAWEDFLSQAGQLRAKKIVEKSAEKRARRFAELQEEEYSVAQELLQKAREILSLPVTKQTIEEPNEQGGITIIHIEPLKVTIKDAAAALKTASELSRLSLGMETSKEKFEIEITADMDKLAKAKEAYMQLKSEMMKTVLMGLTLEDQKKLLAELPMEIAERFNVSPRELTAGDAEEETVVEAEIMEFDPEAESADIPEESTIFWRE